MLLSEASLKDLNTRTPFTVSFWNFRPNIVVTDCEKYTEVILFYLNINFLFSIQFKNFLNRTIGCL